METLRQEILETYKEKANLLKWKIISITALGSITFGIGVNTGSEKSEIFQSLPIIGIIMIPFINICFDLLWYHSTLKVFMIGSFLKNHEVKGCKDIQEYEKHCQEKRYVFALEDCSVLFSSLFISCIMIFHTPILQNNDKLEKYIFLAGLFGLFSSVICYWFYSYLKEEINNNESKTHDKEKEIIFAVILILLGLFLIITP
ncbi:MAG: hypothetical protein COV35_05945 [Alphaproteobacteria bacterium CG11_big_fil_rev_8_21_14_0_20_39_49]|nr:MAG: hypothetical protein COV35_05945 [Alphaproteobacteria bacterium CG11_big_fil_rev_8_21_14_0_20_39_49]